MVKICEQKDLESILLDVIKSNARKLAQINFTNLSFTPFEIFLLLLNAIFHQRIWNFELHRLLIIIFSFLFRYYVNRN